MRDTPEWKRVRDYVLNCGVLRTEPMLGTADSKHLIDRIEELDVKNRERGQLIATHLNVDSLEASWDRIVVAECKREYGDKDDE